MATTYTPHYELGKQTDHADKFSMTVITDNMDKIDAALYGKEDKPELQTSQIDNTALDEVYEGILTGELAAAVTGSAACLGVVRAYTTGEGTYLQIAEGQDGSRRTRYYSSGSWSAWA